MLSLYIQAIGANVIVGLEEDLTHAAFSHWRKNTCIHLLGSYRARRIPIFSMMIYHPLSGKYLHHNFVSVLLNDLYGIQVRGGCACSGPYAQVTAQFISCIRSFICLYMYVLIISLAGVGHEDYFVHFCFILINVITINASITLV